jgi:conserved oligomeric Golgi complex subunit 4
MDDARDGKHGSAKSIYDCASLADVRSTLADLHEREASITARLDELIASQNTLLRDLGRLDLLRAQLGSQVVATRAISHGLLADAAGTAKRISSAVKKLDDEQENVKATLAMVEQVSELKACVLGVHGSMGAPQDWETAALYLSRASKIPKEVVDGEFAEQMVPTAEVPDPPRVTLQNAAESLCGLFLREFEKATKDGDDARVTRFFKLFPLIGKAEVGLDAYGKFVCQGVSARARQNMNTSSAAKSDGFFYVSALTKLFQHIAQIVEGHEPLVQRHYGPGQMTRVIERLQIEADVQGGIILDSWYEDRNVDRKLTDIKAYAFSFLVQSFLSHKPVRSDSPAIRDSSQNVPEDDGIDMKYIDTLLNESALMLSRWALYSQFLSDKSNPDPDSTKDGTVLPKLLLTSGLYRKMTSHILNPFIAMMTFLLRASLEKAFQLDEPPAGISLNLNKPITSQPPYITSAVDDVMYVVAQMLQRAIGTSQRPVVATIIPTIGRVLGSDFIGIIQRKMRDESYPKPIIQDTLPPEDLVLSFLVLMNNIDIATDYIKRIVATQLAVQEPDDSGAAAKSSINASFPFGSDAQFAIDQLKSMEGSFVSKCNDLLRDGVNVIFRQVIKPQIRPMLARAFRDVDYSVSSMEDSQSDGEANGSESLVPSRFASLFNALFRPIKRILTPSSFANLLSISLSSFAEMLERRLWTMQGRISELGAIKLERDLAGIITASTRDGKYELRDSFARCVEIVTVAGMEGEEWDEMLDAQKRGEDLGREWHLTSDERKRARGLVSV